MNELALLGTELCYWWESAPSLLPESDLPAVYRWVVREAGTGRVLEVLLGETPRLSSETERIVSERLHEHRSAGHDVRLEVLHFTHLEVGGHRVPPHGLSDRSIRRLLSNLFAFQHAKEGHRVLDA